MFHYLGPAFAVLLFVRLEPTGVAWLRIATAALIFALWRRPWQAWSGLRRETRQTLLCWGFVLAAMNICFYLAIDALPLGTVAAIEFLPVIVLAALGARTTRNGAALAMAASGVYLLADVQVAGGPVGLLLAAANAILFAAYIVLAHRVSRDDELSSIDGLALAMLIAGVVALPLGFSEAAPALTEPGLLAAAIGVGVCSSVVPYVADQLAMRRLARATYSLLVSLLPATATVIGIVVLAQVPTRVEVVAVLLVIAGVALHHDLAPAEPDATP